MEFAGLEVDLEHGGVVGSSMLECGPHRHEQQVAKGAPVTSNLTSIRHGRAMRVGPCLSGQCRRPSRRGNALIAEVQNAPMFAVKAHDERHHLARRAGLPHAVLGLFAMHVQDLRVEGKDSRENSDAPRVWVQGKRGSEIAEHDPGEVLPQEVRVALRDEGLCHLFDVIAGRSER